MATRSTTLPNQAIDEPTEKLLLGHACRLLDVDPDGSRAEQQRCVLLLFENCDFAPTGAQRDAVEAWLKSTNEGTIASLWPAVPDLAREAAAGLCESIEEFAERFFQLSIADRQRIWTNLRTRAEQFPNLRRRLQQLSPGLDLEIAAGPFAAGTLESRLQDHVLKIFTQHPLARVNTWIDVDHDVRQSPDDWNQAAMRLNATTPRLAALVPELIMGICGVAPRKQQPIRPHPAPTPQPLPQPQESHEQEDSGEEYEGEWLTRRLFEPSTLRQRLCRRLRQVWKSAWALLVRLIPTPFLRRWLVTCVICIPLYMYFIAPRTTPWIMKQILPASMQSYTPEEAKVLFNRLKMEVDKSTASWPEDQRKDIQERIRNGWYLTKEQEGHVRRHLEQTGQAELIEILNRIQRRAKPPKPNSQPRPAPASAANEPEADSTPADSLPEKTDPSGAGPTDADTGEAG